MLKPVLLVERDYCMITCYSLGNSLEMNIVELDQKFDGQVNVVVQMKEFLNCQLKSEKLRLSKSGDASNKIVFIARIKAHLLEDFDALILLPLSNGLEFQPWPLLLELVHVIRQQVLIVQ